MRHSNDHNLYALNATTRNRLWSYKTFDNVPSLLATTHDVRLEPTQRV